MSSSMKKSTRNSKGKRHSIPSWIQRFSNPSVTNLSATGSSKLTVSSSGESPLTIQPGTNVILFGETGVGKSSVINLIAQAKVAKVSSDVTGCTMESTPYDISFDDMRYNIFDTIGLEEPEMGVNGYLTAIEKAFELIKNLEAAGGIHLLLFCMRGGRITATAQSNYRMFYECLCDKKVPIALVFTGLEREMNMEDWWERNKSHIAYYGIKSHGHACITAVHDDTAEEVAKYTESEKKIRDLIKNCALESAAPLPEPNSWFAGFARGLLGFIKKHSHPGNKSLMKTLTKRCGLAQDVAEKIVNMMEKGSLEPNENEAEQPGNEGNPGVSSQGVEASSKAAIDGNPPISQGKDQPPQGPTDGGLPPAGDIPVREQGSVGGGSTPNDTLQSGAPAAAGDGVSVSQDGAQSPMRPAEDIPVGEQGSVGGGSMPNDTLQSGAPAATGDGVSVSQDGAQSPMHPTGDIPVGGGSTRNNIAPQSGAPAANASGHSDNIQAKSRPSRPVSESTTKPAEAQGRSGLSTQPQEVPYSPNAVAQKRAATADNVLAGSTNEETGPEKNESVSRGTGQKKRSGLFSFPLSHAGETTKSTKNVEGAQGKSVAVTDQQKGSRPQENTSQYGHTSNGQRSVSTVPPKNPARSEGGSGPGSSKEDETRPSTDEKTTPVASLGNNSHYSSFSGTSSGGRSFVDASDSL